MADRTIVHDAARARPMNLAEWPRVPDVGGLAHVDLVATRFHRAHRLSEQLEVGPRHGGIDRRFCGP